MSSRDKDTRDELEESGVTGADTAALAFEDAQEEAAEDTTETTEGEDTEEEVLLPPISNHPAAAAHASEEEVAAAKEYGEFFIGLWGDKPNFGCPYCYYATIEGAGAVELHIMDKVNAGDIPHRESLIVPEGV